MMRVTQRNSRPSRSSKRRRINDTPAASQSARSWPKLDARNSRGNVVSFPAGILHGLDEEIWKALAHVSPQNYVLDNKGKAKDKQVRMREALNLIGLGWVATNTTPYRMAVGPMIDQATKFYNTSGWQPAEPLPDFQKVNVQDIPYQMKEFDIGDEVSKGTISDDVGKRIVASLEQTGIAVLRHVVDQETTQTLRSKIRCTKKAQELSKTKANGKGGRYYDIEGSKDLNRLQDIIKVTLDRVVGESSVKRKCILLEYNKGGENWAHRDSSKNCSCKFQGLLMLSDAGEYEGGEFYLAKRNSDRDVVRTYIPKLNAGDLVIFRADQEGGYDHGMMEVTKGERVAVGILQPK